MRKSGFVISSGPLVISSVVEKSLLSVLLLLALGCGPRRAPAVQSPRAFPRAEVPALYSDGGERAIWLAEHYWDKYLDTTVLSWAADSLNGVSPLDLEKEVGTYSTLLGMVPVASGKAAVGRCIGQLEAYELANPSSAVFREGVRLLSSYLGDPNSPVRSDDLYQTIAAGLAVSPLVPEAEHARYAWEAAKFNLNHTGSKAADFPYIDLSGRRGTLYGVSAEYLVLIFGNPDCTACRELMQEMSSIPAVVDIQASGRLRVMDIYIDEDVALWRSKGDTYPSAWINGYDCDGAASAGYHIRAIPSIYLLDASKTVLLKDVPTDRLLQFLQGL